LKGFTDGLLHNPAIFFDDGILLRIEWNIKRASAL